MLPVIHQLTTAEFPEADLAMLVSLIPRPSALAAFITTPIAPGCAEGVWEPAVAACALVSVWVAALPLWGLEIGLAEAVAAINSTRTSAHHMVFLSAHLILQCQR